jgi:hypothetical protein
MIVGITVSVLLAMVLCPVHAAMPDFALPPGAVEFQSPPDFWLSGQPVSLRMFDAPGNIGQVAAHFVAQAAAPHWLMGLPNGLLLTGTADTWLWSVRLEQRVGHTTGLISGQGLRRNASSVRTLPDWLPAGASLQLDVETDESGQHGRHQVYTYPNKPAFLAPSLHSSLTARHWLRVATVAGIDQWRKGADTLELMVVAAGSGSGIVVHSFEKNATQGRR